MKKRKGNFIVRTLLRVIGKSKSITIALFTAIVGAIVCALLPPLVLERIINTLTGGTMIPFVLVLWYFGLVAVSDLLDGAREALLTIFGQRITYTLREEMCAKISRLPASYLTKQEPGVITSRMVNDVDTVESLFTSGIISMFVDACKVISIFAVIFIKSPGLGLVLLVLVPVLFAFTRIVQKRMLCAQIGNRVAVGKVSSLVPETIQNIRMIHTFHKEGYMRKKYDRYIQDSYDSMEKVNFYDAIYSPVILILNAVVIAVVMLLSATESPMIQMLFGMSVGTAVAVINYVGKVFSPLESIGMEIQTIQSAVAGVHRIREFMEEEECQKADPTITAEKMLEYEGPCVELRGTSFGYETKHPIFKNLSFTIDSGEQVTLTGRTGAGKSTVFKLLLGLYEADAGKVLIYGRDAVSVPNREKRKLFGYVEQQFSLVPGNVWEQITLYDQAVNENQVIQAAQLVGLDEAIRNLEHGYDTICEPHMFSQGQWQLLSIARAIVSNPPILLLDEITANLDSGTEQAVLDAIKNASRNRTVISISHRHYEIGDEREIIIGL